MFNTMELLKLKSNKKTKSAWIPIQILIAVLFLSFIIRVPLISLAFYYFGSFSVGLFLYYRHPILYAGFCWWLWFIGPMIKRIIDYQAGFVMPGAWHLIPALVTTIPSITLVRLIPKITHAYKQESLPFILAIVAVFYGFLVELVLQPIGLQTITIFLTWLSSIVFGLHLSINWQDYPDYRRNLQQVFLWGVLVMGVYGIIQFFYLLPWDSFWIELDTQCLCFRNRLWSTTSSPFTFGMFMSVGLLLLLINQGILNFPATVIGYLSFLLTLARSSWLSWIVGLLFLLPSLNTRFQKRLIIAVIITAIALIPITTIEPFSEVISSRLNTFTSLETDGSFNARASVYQNHTEKALLEFTGNGLSGNVENDEFYSDSDAGILDLFFSLGWVGTIPYVSAIIMLFYQLFYAPNKYLDIFIITLRSIAPAIFLLGLIGLPGVIGGQGMIFVWGFLGIAMAGQKYYQSQRSSQQI